MSALKISGCMSVVNGISEMDQEALLARLDQYRADGVPLERAQIMATADTLAELVDERSDFMRLLKEQHPDLFVVSNGQAGDISKSATRDVTETPEFKRWFGDSKVVDKNGKPLVLYHSTTADFDTFEKTADVGFHFGTAAQANKRLEYMRGELARRSGEKKKDTIAGNVMPVYLSISNPLEVTDPGEWTLDQFGPQLVELGIISQSQLEKIEADAEKVSARAGRDYGARFLMQRQHGIDQMRRAIEKAGYDGLKYRNKYEAGRSLKSGSQSAVAWVALYPEQIKSAIGNSGEFDPYEPSIIKSTPRPEFYSQLQRAIEGVPDRLATMAAPAWKQWLTANAPKLGIKADEIEWSGIKDYLDLQGKTKLSKDDLARYLDESGVKVTEVMRGNIDPDALLEQYAMDMFGVDHWEMTRDERKQVMRRIDQELENNTEYDQYTLFGGENYRELLITLPEKDGETPYASSHWKGVPNVLAHIRINDRTDSEGNKVLFVEELQSDWGQEGKKKGFNTPLKTEGWTAKAGDGDPASGPVWEVRNASGQWVLGIPKSYAATPEEAIARAARQGQESRGGSQSSVPSAPFVTKTENWLNLALKRIAMLAVEEGYDKVAFVNGEQSADRYDLSKQVSQVVWNPETGNLYATPVSGGQSIERQSVSREQLPDIIGKEAAERLTSDESRRANGTHLIKGDDLKVGGEGMKTFYDQIVPQAINKLLPKLGGQKLATVEIDLPSNVSDRDRGGFQIEQDLETPFDGDVTLRRRMPNGEVVTIGVMSRAEAYDYTDNPENYTGQSITQPGFDVTAKMRETVGAGVPLFSRGRTDTAEFKKWFGDSKVVDAEGKPLVVYHGTKADIKAFDPTKIGSNFKFVKAGYFFSSDPSIASDFAAEYGGEFENANVIPAYVSIQNPLSLDAALDAIGVEMGEDESLLEFYDWSQPEILQAAKAGGHDGVIFDQGDDKLVIAFRPEQIKSAIGNSGEFDASNPDITKSTPREWMENLASLRVSTNYQLGDLFKSSRKLSWWDRTVGTMYNVAQKNPEFKRVFDAVQTFINDVSAYATRAADMAPTILPKLDTIKDMLKSPISAEDVKALSEPVFGGTVKYARNEQGEIYVEDDVQKAGVVFSDDELRQLFDLNDRQIGLYREFRKATDASLTDLAISDMLRYIGEDGREIRDAVMASGSVDVAAGIIESHLENLIAEEPRRSNPLRDAIDTIQEKAEQANRLMDRGYAPLSRFGQYTVYAVDENNEQLYFGMFESQAEANRMEREMRAQYPNATVTTGTMSQESYKLFSGVTPETLSLFGEALGLEENGIDRNSEIFQQYLKLAKNNRSAMRRLIERKGVKGYSEDAGRVLAGFVLSNARQISTNLHAGEIGRAVNEVRDGDVKDQAVRLMQYVQNPQQEAAGIRGLMFTQFIGGSVASAAVNLTQPWTMTLPYLSQFDGVTGAAKRMAEAVKLASRGIRGDDELKAALKKAEEEGIVSPQEVHHLMGQAQGKGQLQSGDGTRAGDARAKANNFMAKLGLGWGRLFSAAEQFNRRVTFIAAYKLAREQGMDDPMGFAAKAIAETQGVYNKGNRPEWARGAVGSTLFTFKQYSIGYVEFLRRMWGNGPEGKKAVGLALAVLFLMSGMGGLPGMDDLDDVIDGFAQRVLGKSFDSRAAKKQFFASILGQSGAEFVMSGISGLPGAPIDVAGRMGLGNLIPGTGLLTKKRDYGRDYLEIAGPAGTFFTNLGTSLAAVATGEPGKALESAAPVAAQNFIKAVDMAQMGFYRDLKGRKVVDTNAADALFKAIGFQPRAVAQVQEATATQANLITQNKLRETEIADKWARGRIERKPNLIEEAKQELADWNRKNPDSPIKIDAGQINKRVQEANKSKAQRVAATAPKEIRQSVKRELERDTQ